MAPEFNYLSAADYQTTSLVEKQPEKEALVSKDESMGDSTIRKSGDGESASDESECVQNDENTELLKTQKSTDFHENLPTSVQ